MAGPPPVALVRPARPVAVMRAAFATAVAHLTARLRGAPSSWAWGGLASRQGPGWRMIVAWAGRGRATGEGVYPGGQSENPASGWYEDQMADWWNGRYLTPPPTGGCQAGPVGWRLRP